MDWCSIGLLWFFLAQQCLDHVSGLQQGGLYIAPVNKQSDCYIDSHRINAFTVQSDKVFFGHKISGRRQRNAVLWYFPEGY